MWQRFTERTRRIILYAQEEAAKSGQQTVEPLHMLLGITRDPQSVAFIVLQRLGVSAQQVRDEVERQMTPGVPTPNADPKLSPDAKHILELCGDESRRMKHNYVGTEHLLLALSRSSRGGVAEVFEALNISRDDLRNAIINFLGPEAPVTEATRQPPVSAPSRRDYEEQLAQKDARIAELEAQIAALKAEKEGREEH